METFEPIIFIFFILINTFILLLWLYKKRGYKRGKLYESGETVTLYALPRVVFVLYIVFLIFYLADFNKLHLIYICPIIYFIITYEMTKRVIKEDEKLYERKN
ncbi:MAG: hypothetical protein WBC21_04055 [Minisyncoccales bacterium]